MYLNNNALTSPEQWVLVKDTTFIIEKLSVHSLFIVLSFLLGHIAARMLSGWEECGGWRGQRGMQL